MANGATPENGKSGPKYKYIYAELRRSLENSTFSPGDRLPSEHELVEQFSASRPTIGRALAQLEKEGLVERRAGSGTFATAQRRTNNLVFGLMIPELGSTEILEPICRGIAIARIGGQHDLLWGTTDAPSTTKEKQAEQLCQYYLEKKVDGVFFAPMELTEADDEVNLRVSAALDQARIPIVLLDRDICRYPQRSRYDLVGIDNRRAGYVVTEHVLSTGAKRVVFFARPNSAATVAARRMGYRDALWAWNGADEAVEFGDPSSVEGIKAMIERRKPDAVVCANDYTAGQLMTSLSTLGVPVPAQIKVTGVDDIKYASMLQTPLTTIHQPCLDIGAAALGAMLDRASHPNMPARDFFVNFKLVVRQSTGGGDSR